MTKTIIFCLLLVIFISSYETRRTFGRGGFLKKFKQNFDSRKSEQADLCAQFSIFNQQVS